jgi:hypothetical protein
MRWPNKTNETKKLVKVYKMVLVCVDGNLLPKGVPSFMDHCSENKPSITFAP